MHGRTHRQHYTLAGLVITLALLAAALLSGCSTVAGFANDLHHMANGRTPSPNQVQQRAITPADIEAHARR